MFWRRRSEHPGETELSAFLDGEVARPDGLAAHVEACERCRALIEELRSAKAALGALPRVRPPRSFRLGMAYSRPAPLVQRALGFAPAVALSALVLLLAVDFASLRSGGSSDDGGAAGAPAVFKSGADEAAGPAPTPPAARQQAAPSGAGAAAESAEKPAQPTVVPPATGGEDEGVTSSTRARPVEEGRSGRDWLRLLEEAAAVAVAGSLLAVYVWPRFRGGAQR